MTLCSLPLIFADDVVSSSGSDVLSRSMPNADDMVLFAELVKAGSFSRASTQLFLPKSTLSRRIAKLETELGLRLLERNTRTMRLTEAGHTFLQHCQSIAQEVSQATQVIEALAHGPSGVLCVSASYSIGRQLLGPVVESFLVRYPHVRLRLVLCNRRVDLIEEGFDLAIRVGQLTESNLVAKRIGGSQLSFFASPSYLERVGPVDSPSDLGRLCVLHMSEHDMPGTLTLHGPGGTQTVSLKVRSLINDFHLLKGILLDGTGIAILPHYLCTDEMAQGRLVRVLPDWSLPPVDFQAVYPSRRGVTPKLRAFLELLEQHLSTVLA